MPEECALLGGGTKYTWKVAVYLDDDVKVLVNVYTSVSGINDVIRDIHHALVKREGTTLHLEPDIASDKPGNWLWGV